MAGCPFRNDEVAEIQTVGDCQFGSEWITAVAGNIFGQLCERWSQHLEFMDFHVAEGVRQCQSYQKTVLPKTPLKKKQRGKQSATPQLRYNFRCRKKKSNMPGNQLDDVRQHLLTKDTMVLQAVSSWEAPSTQSERTDTNDSARSSVVSRAEAGLPKSGLQEQKSEDYAKVKAVSCDVKDLSAASCQKHTDSECRIDTTSPSNELCSAPQALTASQKNMHNARQQNNIVVNITSELLNAVAASPCTKDASPLLTSEFLTPGLREQNDLEFVSQPPPPHTNPSLDVAVSQAPLSTTTLLSYSSLGMNYAIMLSVKQCNFGSKCFPPSDTKCPTLAASPSLQAPIISVAPPVAPAVSQQRCATEASDQFWYNLRCRNKKPSPDDTTSSSEVLSSEPVIPLSTGQEQEAGDCTEAEKDPSATSSKTDTDPASSDVPPSSIKSDLISASQALSTHLEQLDNSTQGDNAAVDPLLSSQPVSPIAASHVHVASPLGTAEPTDRSLIPDIRKQDSMVELRGHPSPPDTTDPAFPSLSVVAPLLYSTPAPSLQKHMLEVDTLQSTFSHIRTPFSTASPVLKAPNLFSTPGVHDVAPAISQETVGISPQFGKAGNSLEDPGSVLNWPSDKHVNNLVKNAKTFLQRNTNTQENDPRKMKESMERKKRKASERQRELHAKKVRENEEKKKKREEKIRLAKERRAAIQKAKEAKARQLLADKDKKFIEHAKIQCVREEIGKKLGPSKVAAHLDMVRQEAEKNRPKLKELFSNMKLETAATKVPTLPPRVDKDHRLTCTLTGPSTPGVPLIEAAGIVSYEMTPLQLDDTDEDIDEHHPKRRIPAWAQSSSVSLAISHQSQYGPSGDDIFATSDLSSCDLATVFDCPRYRYNKRTSSAVWTHFPISPAVEKH